MKILLINSDIAKNRGDRAIAEGLLKLIQTRYPGAEVTGLSERSHRDEDWYNIRFLKSDVYTLNPWHWLLLLWEAFRSDKVFWGGGEYLKDYTNKASLWYWFVKTALLKLVNRNLYGTFQGIGPTEAKSSRWFIVKIVNMTKKFIVRDKESYEKLLAWGADIDKISFSSDPAVFLESTPNIEESIDWQATGMSKLDLLNFIAISPRNWFHYKKGGMIPQRFKPKVSTSDIPTENSTYKNSIIQIINFLTRHGHKVILIPMHMSEDVSFCEEIKSSCANHEIKILDQDTLNPEQFRYVLSKAKVMIGFRLHSNIIATSNYTPSLNYYYVDKGRAYFDQIKQSHNCFPIEILLEDDFIAQFEEDFSRLYKNSKQTRRALEREISNLKTNLISTMAEL